MKLFLSFVEKESIIISVPELQESEVDAIITDAYNLTSFKFDKVVLKNYIMNGYGLLKTREKEQYKKNQVSGAKNNLF